MVDLIRAFVGLTSDDEARTVVDAQPQLRQLEVISLLVARAEVAKSKQNTDLEGVLTNRAAIVAGSTDSVSLVLITDLVRVTYELSGISQTKAGLAHGRAVLARALSGDPVEGCHPLIQSLFWDAAAGVAGTLGTHLAASSFHAEAVALTRRAIVDGQGEAEGHQAALQSRLASRLLALHEQHGERSLVDEAVEVAQLAVALTSEDDPGLPRRLGGLATCLARSANAGGGAELHCEAVEVARRACEVSGLHGITDADQLSGLADRLADLYRSTGETDALVEAVSTIRSAAAEASEDAKPRLLSSLADHLLFEAEEQGSRSSSGEAVAVARQAVELTALEDPVLLPRLDQLARGLVMLCDEPADEKTSEDDSETERRDEDRPLDEAISVSQRVAALTPDGDELVADRFERLAMLEWRRHTRRQDPESLIGAVMAARRSASDTEPTHERYANRLTNLASLLNLVLASSGDDRAKALGATRVEVVEEALIVARLCIDLTAEDDAELPTRLGLLATALTNSYRQNGQQEPLDLAVTAAARSVEVTQSDSPALASRLDRLALLAAGGTRPDLELSISASRRALALTSEGETTESTAFSPASPTSAGDAEERRAMRLVRLAKRLEQLHDGAGDRDALAEAVRLAEEALLANGDDGQVNDEWETLHRRLLAKQNDPLLIRAALDRSIVEARRKLGVMEPESEEAAGQRSHLVTCLAELFAVSNELPALDEAIAVCRVGGVGDEEARLGALATNSRRRYDAIGEVADLATAVEALGEALKLGGEQGAKRPLLLGELAGVLLDWYKAGGDRQHLDRAVTEARRAVDSSEPDSQAHVSGRQLLDAGLSLLNEVGQRELTVENRSEVDGLDARPESQGLEVAAEAVPEGLEAAAHGVSRSDHSDSDQSDSDQQAAPPLTDSSTLGQSPADLINEVELLYEHYESTGERRLLNEAVANARLATEASIDDASARADSLYALATVLSGVYAADADVSVLEESIVASREAIALTPEDSPARISRLNNVANRLARHHALTGQLDSMSDAVTMARLAVEQTPADDPEAPSRLNNLANHLARLHGATGNVDLLVEAIDVGNRAVEASGSGSADQSTRLHNLSNHLRRLHEATGSVDALEKSVETITRAVVNLEVGSADHARFRNGLGERLAMRFAIRGDIVDLEAAIASFRGAAEASSPESSDLGGYLDSLVESVAQLLEATGREELLDDLVEAARWAVTSTPTNHSRLAGRLDQLGRCLYRHHAVADDRESLVEAIEASRRTIKIRQPDDDHRARQNSELSSRLTRLHAIDADSSMLVEAADAARQAVEATPTGDPDIGRYLSNLANRLAKVYEALDDRPALEEAVSAGRRALEATPSDSPDLPTRLNNQANHLGRLHAVSGRREHIDQAVDLSRRAIEMAPEPSQGMVGRLNNLANHLTRHYAETNERPSLDEALATARQAIQLAQTNGWPVSPRLETLEGRLAKLAELEDSTLRP